MKDSPEFLNLLHLVLNSLAQSKINSSVADFFNSGMSIDDISDELNLNLSDEKKQNIESRLKVDGFIEYSKPSLPFFFRISDIGFVFWNNGGYKQQKIDKELILKNELNGKRFSKKQIILTIIILALTLIVISILGVLGLLSPE